MPPEVGGGWVNLRVKIGLPYARRETYGEQMERSTEVFQYPKWPQSDGDSRKRDKSRLSAWMLLWRCGLMRRKKPGLPQQLPNKGYSVTNRKQWRC